MLNSRLMNVRKTFRKREGIFLFMGFKPVKKLGQSFIRCEKNFAKVPYFIRRMNENELAAIEKFKN